jgi:hypothetical protein
MPRSSIQKKPVASAQTTEFPSPERLEQARVHAKAFDLTVDEWEEKRVEQARHLYNTPGDVLELERKRQEELDHARELARVRADASLSPRKKKASRDTSRLEQWREVISRAAREAGSDIQLFCEFLDRDRVSVPRSWEVVSWLDAYNKLKPRRTSMRSRIRGVKFRYRSSS